MTAAAAVPAPPAAAPAKKTKLLFVDDEPSVLEAIALNLRRGYDVQTATSGAAGLELLKAHPDVTVIVSDMRMPQMNGAVFLTHARELAPNAVRMLLTGQTDIDSAVQAINKGQIFRFLTKPCPKDDLRTAIEAGVEQYRLLTAEKELLEQTLRGSVKLLVDLLAITSPAAFGRANRIKTWVLELGAKLGIAQTWQFEVAALTSQLGYITLPKELCDKLERGAELTLEEKSVLARAPATTAGLLAQIPRLEVVCEILQHHLKPPRRNPQATERARLVELGSHCLRIALDVDELEVAGNKDPVPALAARDGYDHEVMDALLAVDAERKSRQSIRDVALTGLRVGMTFAEDVKFTTGALLVSRGYEVTASFIERLRNFPPNAIQGPLRVKA